MAIIAASRRRSSDGLPGCVNRGDQGSRSTLAAGRQPAPDRERTTGGRYVAPEPDETQLARLVTLSLTGPRQPEAPSEVAEFDFSRLGLLPDPASAAGPALERGRRRTVWALIIVLRHSRHCFVWPTRSQTLDALRDKLRAASGLDWERFRRIDASPESAAGDLAAAIDLLWAECDEYSSRLPDDRERALVSWRLHWLTRGLESAVGARCLAVDCLHGPSRLDERSRPQVRRLKLDIGVRLSSVVRIDAEQLPPADDAGSHERRNTGALMRHHVRHWRDGLLVDNPAEDWPAQDLSIALTSVSLYQRSLAQRAGGSTVRRAQARQTRQARQARPMLDRAKSAVCDGEAAVQLALGRERAA